MPIIKLDFGLMFSENLLSIKMKVCVVRNQVAAAGARARVLSVL